MHIIYSNQPAAVTGRTSITKQDPHKHYNTHYTNARILRSIMTNMVEPFERRQQATLELTIAERRMEHWKRRDGFDMSRAAREERDIRTRMKAAVAG